MRYTLFPPAGPLGLTLRLPASKSISNRVLVLHALARGSEVPLNLSTCDDTCVMLRAFSSSADVVDIMAAGTAMRFLTAYYSVTPGKRLLTGTTRMQQRPIGILVNALRSLGARITYTGKEGYPPLSITGAPLQGGKVTLAGNVSSQYISALLMIGPVLPGGLELQLTGNLVSRPYIDLTLQLMRRYGARCGWEGDGRRIVVSPGGYKDTPFLVESDWSAASYWYELLALQAAAAKSAGSDATGSVELSGLFAHSDQGDSRVAELFKRLGIDTTYTDKGVCLTCGVDAVQSLEADLVEVPDLAQTMVVTCCLMGIPFRFSGLQSLRIKETDRIQALICELRKLGYRLQAEDSGVLAWQGARCRADEAPVIATYEDHRMALAFAPVALMRPGITIAQPFVVSKSYPDYWRDLRGAGFRVEETDA
ncbi:MAG: 3-phosphoshikimate 1-carboxyvinyltransferase [Prevotellaceae bacterium]|nr:3-phosphoshikimate 1-carboxyvinyltransferase [Prevotellaceae bacterium]